MPPSLVTRAPANFYKCIFSLQALEALWDEVKLQFQTLAPHKGEGSLSRAPFCNANWGYCIRAESDFPGAQLGMLPFRLCWARPRSLEASKCGPEGQVHRYFQHGPRSLAYAILTLFALD